MATTENSSAVGNAAAMREALVFADRQLRMATESDTHGDDPLYLVGCMRTVAVGCRAALSAPPRNCDVGTVKDQTQRFYRFCKSRSGAAIGGECDPNCPCYDCDDVCQCLLEWAQMPYEEGDKS